MNKKYMLSLLSFMVPFQSFAMFHMNYSVPNGAPQINPMQGIIYSSHKDYGPPPRTDDPTDDYSHPWMIEAAKWKPILAAGEGKVRPLQAGVRERSARLSELAKSDESLNHVLNLGDAYRIEGDLCVQHAHTAYLLQKGVEDDISVRNYEKEMQQASGHYEIAIQILDFGLGITPGLGMAKSLVEATTGYNYLTGETLSDFERSLAALDVASFGMTRIARTTTLRAASMMVKTPYMDIVARSFQGVSVRELREVLTFLHKHIDAKTEQGWEKIREIVKAFTWNTRVSVLRQDTLAFRYYDGIHSGPLSHWVTAKPLDLNNPAMLAELLALPPLTVLSNLKEIQYIVPKGTELLDGLAHTFKGRKGGHHQYWIPDPSVMKEVP